jgi:hypothetical protein
MGLAPGVVIRPVQLKIPRMGVPLELMAAKMQTIQQAKTKFDNLAELTPQALQLEGDQKLLAKYNQYVDKLSKSVADAFASGDAKKASRMMSAAKSQLSREWKQGGVAYALKDRATAMSEGVNEIMTREIGDDYKEVNRTVDLYRFKKQTGDIGYDLESGQYNKIGKPIKTTHVDLVAKAKEYAESLGIDKTGYLDFVTAARQGLPAVAGLVHKEQVDIKKIEQQLDMYLNDPQVKGQLAIEQEYKNITNGRYEDTDKLTSDALSYLDADIDKLNTSKKDFDKRGIIQQKTDLARLGLYQDADFSATENDALTKAKDEYFKLLDKQKESLNETKSNIDDLDVANGVLFTYETQKRRAESFRNQFGISETISNLKWPDDLDNLSKSASDLKSVIMPSTVVPASTKTQDVKEKLATTLKDSEELFVNASAELMSFFNEEDVKSGLPNVSEIVDVSELPTAKTQDDKNLIIQRNLENISNLKKLINIADDLSIDEETKKQTLVSAFGVTNDKASELLAEYKDNNQKLKQIVQGFSTAYKDKMRIENAYNAYTKAAVGTFENYADNLEGLNDLKGIEYKNDTLSIGSTDIKISNEQEYKQFYSDIIELKRLIDLGEDIKNNPIAERLYNTVKTTEDVYIPGALVTGISYTKGVNEEVINKLVDNVYKELNIKFTPVEYMHAIEKPTAKVNVGLNTIHRDITNIVKGTVFDYATANQDKLLDLNNKNEEVEIRNIDLSKLGAMYIGFDFTGESFIQFDAPKVDGSTGKFKVSVPPNYLGDVSKGLLEELTYGYSLGEVTYDNLIIGLNNYSRISNKADDYAFAYTLDKTINTADHVKEPTNIAIEGTTISNGNGKTLLEQSGTLNQQQGNYKLQKVKSSGGWKYYITFTRPGENTDNALPNLQPKGNKFDVTDNYYYLDYETAQQQFLIYENQELFEANVVTEDTMEQLY